MAAVALPLGAPPGAPAAGVGGNGVSGEEFDFRTLPPQITYQRRGVQPPVFTYISREDHLRVQVWSSVHTSIEVHVRMLLADGSMQHSVHQLEAPGIREMVEYRLNVAESFLLGLTVVEAGGAQAGSVYVSVALMRTAATPATVAQQLLSGYVAPASRLAWPAPRWVMPVEGPGRIIRYQADGVISASDIEIIVPTAARWRIAAMRCDLSASAVVGNRRIVFEVGTGFTVDFSWTGTTLLPANTGLTYYHAVGVAPVSSPAAFIESVPLFTDIVLVGGMFLRARNFGVQIGDVLGPMRVYVEEWLEPVS